MIAPPVCYHDNRTGTRDRCRTLWSLVDGGVRDLNDGYKLALCVNVATGTRERMCVCVCVCGEV